MNTQPALFGWKPWSLRQYDGPQKKSPSDAQISLGCAQVKASSQSGSFARGAEGCKRTRETAWLRAKRVAQRTLAKSMQQSVQIAPQSQLSAAGKGVNLTLPQFPPPENGDDNLYVAI